MGNSGIRALPRGSRVSGWLAFYTVSSESAVGEEAIIWKSPGLPQRYCTYVCRFQLIDSCPYFSDGASKCKFVFSGRSVNSGFDIGLTL